MFKPRCAQTLLGEDRGGRAPGEDSPSALCPRTYTRTVQGAPPDEGGDRQLSGKHETDLSGHFTKGAVPVDKRHIVTHQGQSIHRKTGSTTTGTADLEQTDRTTRRQERSTAGCSGAAGAGPSREPPRTCVSSSPEAKHDPATPELGMRPHK